MGITRKRLARLTQEEIGQLQAGLDRGLPAVYAAQEVRTGLYPAGIPATSLYYLLHRAGLELYCTWGLRNADIIHLDQVAR